MRTLHFNKSTGPKPSKAALRLASTLATDKTGDHITVAMALRPNGVTQNEVVSLLGHPHRNKIRKLVQDNKVKVHTLADGSRATRIKLVKR